MRKGFVRNRLPLCLEALNNVIDLDGVPIEDRVGNQAQAACLIHNLLVITCGELPLIRKKDPSWQLVPVFTLIQLQLYRLSQSWIGNVAQDVLSLENPSKVGECLGKSVSRETVGEPLDNHMRRGGSVLEGNSYPDHFLPLLLNDGEINGFR